MKKIVKSENETIAEGKRFAKKLRGGDVVLLYGELGAGKTTFTKGIAQGLGVTQNITSPTFTLMGVYSGEKYQLCHIDTYRLKNADELRAIGAEDFIGDSKTITIIEWPEEIAALLKKIKTKKVRFTHTKTGRSITF